MSNLRQSKLKMWLNPLPLNLVGNTAILYFLHVTFSSENPLYTLAATQLSNMLQTAPLLHPRSSGLWWTWGHLEATRNPGSTWTPMMILHSRIMIKIYFWMKFNWLFLAKTSSSLRYKHQNIFVKPFVVVVVDCLAHPSLIQTLNWLIWSQSQPQSAHCLMTLVC